MRLRVVAAAGIDRGLFGRVASGARGELFEMVAHELRCAVGMAGGNGGVKLAVGLARRVGHVGLLGVQRVERLLDERPRRAEHGQQGLVVRRDHQRGMEVQARGSRITVGRLNRTVNGRLERDQVSRGGALRGEQGGLGLQRLAVFCELQEGRPAQVQVGANRVAEEGDIRL